MKSSDNAQGERGYLSPFLWLFLGLGMILSFFLTGKEGYDTIFSTGGMRALRMGNFESRSFMMQILFSRLVYVGVVIFLSTTFLQKLFLRMQPILFCLGLGGLLGAAVMQFGIKGFLLVFVGMLPHMPVYLLVLYFLIQVLWERKYYDKQFFIAVFILLFLVIIGCVLESYVNPMIVAKVLKIF